MKHILLFLLIVSSISANAQTIRFTNPNPYWEGKILLSDDKVLEGFIKVPYKNNEKNIKYKPSKNGTVKKIKLKDIHSILVKSKDGKPYLYENVYWKRSFRKSLKKDRMLLLVQAKNEYATFYQSAFYIVSKRADKILLEHYMEGGSTLEYLIRKNKDDFAYHYFTHSQIGHFKKHIAENFQEAPDLVQQVENGELKQGDLELIIDTYIEATNSMK